MDGEKAHYQMGVEADAVLRLGMLYMGAGTSGYRVLRGMKRVARALGFDKVDAIVTVTTINCTIHRGRDFRTIVAHQDNPGVDASRIEALEGLTHNINRRITAEWLNERLDEIEKTVVKRWKLPSLALAAGFACAGFAFLNHFPWVDVAVVAIAASCGQLTRGLMTKARIRQIGGVAAGAVVACLVFFLFDRMLTVMGVVAAGSMTPGFVASVLFLVPGFPLFSAMIDLSRFDIAAGISRLTYALTIISTATFSVGLVSWLIGLNPAPVNQTHSDLTWFLLAALASFVGIAGFAFLFNSSRRMVVLAALAGTIANVGRLIVLDVSKNVILAAFVGGLIVGTLGWVLSRWGRIPRVTTTVPAAVIMVPGPAMFGSMYSLNVGDMQAALADAASAAVIIFAIGAGLIIMRMFTDVNWAFGHYIDFSKHLEEA